MTKPIEVTIFPSSFAEFVVLPGNAIRLGLWPSEVYAGRLTVWGERVRVEELPKSGGVRI